jgi:ABC-type transport system involved in cytochrome bd biosynthesis fused ATPase/permease subunit
LTKEKLGPADIDYLEKLCFQEANQPSELPESPDLSALLVVNKSSTVSLRLEAISEINGIEGLNPRVPLTFSANPLTVVYGGTGSGKSSYVRILNNICGSKNRRELLGDVLREADL